MERRQKPFLKQSKFTNTPNNYKKFDFTGKKPLYILMKEKYEQDILMPQLEHEKIELAKKHLLFQSLSHEDLQKHKEQHEKILKLQKIHRKKQLEKKNLDAEINQIILSPFSKTHQKVLKNEKIKENLIKKEKENLKSNINRKQQYSKLIKELFSPKINKKKVIQFDSKSLSKSNKDFNDINSNSQKSNKKISISGLKSKSLSLPNFKSRKWPKNKMVPEPSPKKIGIKKDYLAEIRKQRENNLNSQDLNDLDWEKELNSKHSDAQIFAKVKAKAALIEKKAMKKEVILKMTRNTKSKEMKVIDQVNNLLISSIKAKIALLEKVSTVQL
jgi:hypothetical protein